jgi:trehalose 6-phosphate synthase
MSLHPLQLTCSNHGFPASEWTAERLQELVLSTAGGQVMVVSCREPYSHEHTAQGVRVTSPASGLVTALEPIVRACGGTWIAHASGSADAAFVDAHGVCQVPPQNPEYSLRRVWLEDEEKRHFLDGFANDSMWPMCHRCDVEPTFRASDWRHYQRVNERFAEAVVQATTQPDPLVLVQDYHFALLPKLIRARLPTATVVAFWHIPWPARDQLEACPWWPALVRGLMSSSIVGFQTARDQAHFEAAVAVCQTRAKPGANLTVVADVSEVAEADAPPVVAAYPISVPWPTKREMEQLPSVADCRSQVLRDNGLAPRVRLIVGVDRFDYTKGLLDKVRAMESLLDRHPQWHGLVSLVQIAAPTRSDVPAYAAYQDLVRAEVDRINRRLGCDGMRPIVFLASQHDRDAVCRLYRAACVCAVTSLHDGMNLVSKEFVSVRDDEQGVLVLSAFAGAAEELQPGAVVVDPRDSIALADTLAQALAMNPAQQRQRMARMRQVVRQANIYQWAGTMLSDAAVLRKAAAEEAFAAWPEVA